MEVDSKIGLAGLTGKCLLAPPFRTGPRGTIWKKSTLPGSPAHSAGSFNLTKGSQLTLKTFLLPLTSSEALYRMVWGVAILQPIALGLWPRASNLQPLTYNLFPLSLTLTSPLW